MEMTQNLLLPGQLSWARDQLQNFCTKIFPSCADSILCRTAAPRKSASFEKFLGGPYHGSKRRRLRTLIFAAKCEFMLHCRSCVVIGDDCRIESSIIVNVLDKIDYRRINVANLGFSADNR